ncbi:RdRp [Guagua virus]|uniref:RNA-directed RNA polymerase L n=1 Tax=Guagua virus TaxID=2689370 RepID=A0A6B9KGI9_9VIRU|nr:RdRp [Guagua virus]QHA33854.1 RdRp [Guagua virus]
MCLFRNLMIIGDVAVSRSPEEVGVRKKVKYKMLMDSIKIANPNLMIIFEAFIFKDDGSNIEQVQERIKEIIKDRLPFMTWKFGDWEKRLREEILSWNYRLNYISSNVIDKQSYIYSYQQLMANEESEILLGNMYIVDEYTPKVSEREIAKYIFNEITNENNEHIKLTKNIDIDSSKNKIDELREVEFDDAAIKHCIPYIFNSGDRTKSMDLELLEDYKNDLSSHNQSLANLFPTGNQLNKMFNIKKDFLEIRKNQGNKNRSDFLKEIKGKYNQVTPYYCRSNELIENKDPSNIKELYLGKVNKHNDMKKPASIKKSQYKECVDQIDGLINIMNRESKSKSINLTFDTPDRGDRYKREKILIDKLSPEFERMNSKIVTCLLSCVRKLVNDVAHMPTSMKPGIYYSVPIQKNMITMIFTGTNLTKRNPSVYFATISRFKKDDEQDMELFRVQHNISLVKNETEDYYYLSSKLNKYELEKMSKLCNVDSEFRTHYMSMMSMCDLNDEDKEKYLHSYSGLMGLVLLDLHQKPSEMLDLMKYLVAMPMSTHSSLDKLLEDKLMIMLKTNLDVFIYENIFKFLKRNIELNKTRRTNTIKVQKNGYILPDSFNIEGEYSMFCNVNIVTKSLLFYISESQLIFHARPKKLYNSQFIDKCAFKVADYNNRMETDEQMNKGWTTKGYNLLDEGKFDFPFLSDFSFSRDAMYYAQLDEDANLARFIPSLISTSNKKVSELFPNNLSMRGACIIPGSKLDKSINAMGMSKEKIDEIRKKVNKYHKNKDSSKLIKIKRSTTAMLSGLKMMEDYIKTDNTEKCRVGQIMSDHKDDKMYFNMSEKEQRGGGRPIGSADFYTKQRLYCIEMIYQKIGEKQGENLMAKKVNRSAKLSDVSREMITQAVKEDKKILSYIVMDQSQFSESDNINKFIANIEDNRCIPANLKSDMIDSIDKMKSREQFFPKIPIKLTKEMPKYITENGGIKGVAGWVQGMLNISSTHIHIIAVKWITKLFNRFYKEFVNKEFDEIKVEHLVNSDDSFAVVCSKLPHMITDFYEFFLLAKRMFCLKQNKKKSYMSTMIGEVIQKYVANGSTVNIWAKDAVSVFNSMRGLDMYKDITAALGSLQTLSRNGAPEDACCYVRAECKTKIMNTYNVNKGKINDLDSLEIDIGKLPVELLGWPKYITTYELCVSGSLAQSHYCMTNYKLSIDENGIMSSKEASIVTAAILVNMSRKIGDEEEVNVYDKEENVQEENILSKSVKRVREILEYDDSIDEIDNLDIDELQIDLSTREKNVIAFRSMGLSVLSGNFTRSMLNPFSFCHPFTQKVTDTVKFLKQIEGDPSGLQGLLKVRTSIKTSVSDIKNSISSLLMNLSESGFNNDFRMIASASSIVASSRSVLIGNSKNRHTIRDCFKVLCDISYKMYSKALYRKSQEYFQTIMRDPTYRSEMADEILVNMRDVGFIEARPNVVTLMPEMESDLGITNPLQLVLAEIVKPGVISSEGYSLNYPDQLTSDINIIKSKFGDWLDLSNDKLQVACGIYYHYLNVRRGRYVVGPPLDKSDMMSFLISWYKEKISGNISLVSEFTGTTLSRIEEFKDYSPNLLMSVTEMYFKLCVINKIIDKEVFINNVEMTMRGYKYNLKNLINNELFDALVNELDTQFRTIVGAMALDVTGDDKWLRKYIKSETVKIDWVKEQRKDFNPASKRVTWVGEFIVDVVKGEDAVRITGEPGKMKMIKSTTQNVRKISELLLYLRKNNRFDNYEIKQDINHLYNDRFFSTWDDIDIVTFETVLDPSGKYPNIRTNPIKEGKDISYFKEKGMIPIEIVNRKDISSGKSKNEEYIKFEIEVGRFNNLIGITKSMQNIYDAKTGTSKLTEKDIRNRITRIDSNYSRFTTTGMSSKNITIAGINLDIFIKDDEIKKIIRNQINMISSANIKKYINMIVTPYQVLSSIFKVMCSVHIGTSRYEDELFSEMKIIDIDITADALNYEQDIEKLMSEETELDELVTSQIIDLDGSIASKLLNSYSATKYDKEDLIELTTMLSSKQLGDKMKRLLEVGDRDNWSWESEIIENGSSIFSMFMTGEVEDARDFVAEPDNDDDLEEELFNPIDDDCYLNNKTKSYCEKVISDMSRLMNNVLANKLYKYDVITSFMYKTLDNKLNRRNKYIDIAKLITYNIDKTIRSIQ